MTRVQFFELLKAVEEAFKPYAKIQSERIFEHCQQLTAEQFRKICINFIDHDKRPGVFDFKLRAQALLAAGMPTKVVPDCDNCCNTGLFEIFSLHEEFDGSIFIRCKCEHGEASSWQNIPQWEKGMEKLFKPKRIEPVEFRPQGKPIVSEEKISISEQHLDLWKDKIKASRKYFDFTEQEAK